MVPKRFFVPLSLKRIPPNFCCLKPNSLVDAMIAQVSWKSKFFKNMSIGHPQNQDTSLRWSLRALGEHHPGIGAIDLGKAKAVFFTHGIEYSLPNPTLIPKASRVAGMICLSASSYQPLDLPKFPCHCRLAHRGALAIPALWSKFIPLPPEGVRGK